MNATLAKPMPRSTGERFVRFALVGAIGILLQLAALRFLTHELGMGYLLATVLAVEITILHNFVWHEWFTWSDRPANDAGTVIGRLLKLNGSTGGISLTGNVVVMQLMVEVAHLNVLLSNVIAVACCSVLNFFISDRLIFTSRRAGNDG